MLNSKHENFPTKYRSNRWYSTLLISKSPTNEQSTFLFPIVKRNDISSVILQKRIKKYIYPEINQPMRKKTLFHLSQQDG